MKKLICLLLTLALALSCTSALAKVEYSLLEKWQRQVDFGNGIKGTLTLNASGQAAWVQLLAPLADVPIELRAIHDGGAFQYRAYVEKDESMLGLTQLYGDGQTVYLKSELLPDTLLSLPIGGDALNTLAGATAQENPTLYSTMLNLLNIPQTTWDSKWIPALEPYETAIDMWLENYASAPSVLRGEDGSATVLVRYDVPAQAVKAEMKGLWANVLQDGTLLPLLQGEMNQNQQETYLDGNWQYYYNQVIDALPLEGSVILEREMTAKGDTLRTDMVFPLANGGWNSLAVHQTGESTTVSLLGTDKELAFELTKKASSESSASYAGKLRYVPADKAQKALAVAFTLAETKAASVDEDTRSHDITNWTLTISPDGEHVGEGWQEITPMELALQLHLHSKSQQSNPVTVDVDANVKLPDAKLAVNLHLITRSKWVMDTLPTDGAADVTTLSTEEVTQKLTDLGLNGLTVIQRMNQESTAEEQTAEPTDTAEPSVAPTDEAEPSAAPADTSEPSAEPTEGAK